MKRLVNTLYNTQCILVWDLHKNIRLCPQSGGHCTVLGASATFHKTVACRDDITQNLMAPTTTGAVKKVWL